jgi:hypothetical protein
MILSASGGWRDAYGRKSVSAPKPNLEGDVLLLDPKTKFLSLVTIGACHDCHTPKKMTPNGPDLDSSLLLSGHPAQSPPLDVDRKEIESKGLAVTGDLTEWIGPWGISYTANLTSDASGIGKKVILLQL